MGHPVGFIFVLTSVFLTAAAQSLFIQSLQTSCGNFRLLNYTNAGCCMLENNRSQWYSENFPNASSNYNSISENLPWRFESNIASWGRICMWASTVADCIDTKFPECSSGIGNELFNDYRSYPFFLASSTPGSCPGSHSLWGYEIIRYISSWTTLLDFYKRTCSRQHIKPEIQLLLNDSNADLGFQCISGVPRRNMFRCAQSLLQNGIGGASPSNTTQSSSPATTVRSYTKFIGDLVRSTNVTDVICAMGEFRQYITRQRLVREIMKCVISTINRSPCNTATKKVLYHLVRINAPNFIDDSQLNIDTSIKEDFSSKLRCSVGVFGDPHLRQCGKTNLVTCSAPGEQTYISNDYFTITGTNVEIGRAVPGSPNATTLRSVTISFKSLDTGSVFATYSANDGDLPQVFDNNARVAGSGKTQVVITADAKRVRIVQRSTGTIFTVRQWNGNYFFNVRAAQSLIVASTGLLSEGCPENQTLTFDLFRNGRKKRAITEAECQACNTAFTNQALVPTCMLDCLATENRDLALSMSLGAQEEEALVEAMDNDLIQGTISQDSNYSGASQSTLGLIGWIVVLTAVALTSNYSDND